MKSIKLFLFLFLVTPLCSRANITITNASADTVKYAIMSDTLIMHDFEVHATLPITVGDFVAFEFMNITSSEVLHFELYQGQSLLQSLNVDDYDQVNNLLTFQIPDLIVQTNQSKRFTLKAILSLSGTLGNTYSSTLVDIGLKDDQGISISNTGLVPLESNIITNIVDNDPILVSLVNEDFCPSHILGGESRKIAKIRFVTGNSAAIIEDFKFNLIGDIANISSLDKLELLDEQGNSHYVTSLTSSNIFINNIDIQLSKFDTVEYLIELSAHLMGYNQLGMITGDMQISGSVNDGDTYYLGNGQTASVIHDNGGQTSASEPFSVVPILMTFEPLLSYQSDTVLSDLQIGSDKTLYMMSVSAQIGGNTNQSGMSYDLVLRRLVFDIVTDASFSLPILDKILGGASLGTITNNQIIFDDLDFVFQDGDTQYYMVSVDIDVVGSTGLEIIFNPEDSEYSTQGSYPAVDYLGHPRICNTPLGVEIADLCENILNLIGTTNQSSNKKASIEITSEQKLLGAHVIYDAPTVTLLPGFETELGRIFETKGVGCP